MTAIGLLDRQINDYLGRLSTKQKKAVLTVVKTFAEEQSEPDHWKDENFVSEMNSRLRELESGKVKGSGWDEVKQKARQSIKPRKTK